MTTKPNSKAPTKKKGLNHLDVVRQDNEEEKCTMHDHLNYPTCFSSRLSADLPIPKHSTPPKTRMHLYRKRDHDRPDDATKHASLPKQAENRKKKQHSTAKESKCKCRCTEEQIRRETPVTGTMSDVVDWLRGG